MAQDVLCLSGGAVEHLGHRGADHRDGRRRHDLGARRGVGLAVNPAAARLSVNAADKDEQAGKHTDLPWTKVWVRRFMVIGAAGSLR